MLPGISKADPVGHPTESAIFPRAGRGRRTFAPGPGKNSGRSTRGLRRFRIAQFPRLDRNANQVHRLSLNQPDTCLDRVPGFDHAHTIVHEGHCRAVVPPVVAENNTATRMNKLRAFSTIQADFCPILRRVSLKASLSGLATDVSRHLRQDRCSLSYRRDSRFRLLLTLSTRMYY